MNEVIKQLAVEAMVEHCVSHVRLKNFSDLIIEECLCLIDGAVQHRIPASTYVDLIKEHFGVEE